MAYNRPMPDILITPAIIWFAVINVVTLIVFARDKKHARKGERRVPEFTLFMLTILGGFIGALCGMDIFRHKTRKWYFSFGIPLIAFLETGLILFLIFS